MSAALTITARILTLLALVAGLPSMALIVFADAADTAAAAWRGRRGNG
jgi:flagellar biosynthesis component FlhA